MKGYYSKPTISDEKIVFVSEDDLWSVDKKGGTPFRLTANLGITMDPCLSDDGKWLAFITVRELYVMPATGGEATRLTWCNANMRVVGWKGDKIIFASDYHQHFMGDFRLYEIDRKGGSPELLPFGNASTISYGLKGVVLGKNTNDPARWKRYKGGTAGYLLVDKEGKGVFKPLLKLKGNFACPMWIGSRIYFISDYEGIGNLYSCKPDGKDIRKHSHHTDYYARNAKTDGRSIVWHAGGDIYCYDVKADQYDMVEINYTSPFVQRHRKFVDALQYKEDVILSNDGGSLAYSGRGKVFTLGNWEGSVQQYGARHGVRYRLAEYTPDGKKIVMISDEGDKERIEIHPVRKDFEVLAKQDIIILDKVDIGRPYSFQIAQHGNRLLLNNHRNELLLINYETGDCKVIDQNKFGLLQGYDISPDGRYIAYGIGINRKQSLVRMYDIEEEKYYDVTKPVLRDYSPVFDPEGKYLYFLSMRTFEPVSDTIQFDFIFPNAIKPYLIALQKDVRSPFIPELMAFEPKPVDKDKIDDKEESKEKSEGEKREVTPKAIMIDFDGIQDRIVEFPVPAGLYFGLKAAPGRIFYGVAGLQTTNNEEWKYDLLCYDLKKLESWNYVSGISDYSMSGDHSALLIDINKKLRVISAKLEPKTPLPQEEGFKRKAGWVDLSRIKMEIDPISEWQQMFREAWRLQKYYFWTEDMSGIDWKRVYDRYYPLVARCGCRMDFSDIIWEMQGELGTSHCYEFGGDYRKPPYYPIGNLGIDYKYNAKKKAYEITHIVKGDRWVTENRPALANIGLEVDKGWFITSINGLTLTKDMTPDKALVNMANQLVQLSVNSPEGKIQKNITVKASLFDVHARYRDWVESNREYVHHQSKGKIGYIHIPNMGYEGLQEFYRYFLAEVDYDGLVVDVRHNGGGSTSGLFLQRLARKRIGYDLTRWWGANPYPEDSPNGTIVALTDEYAGSDGDIFSHSFKLMKLGKLVGKRTWGGVIGIWPRHWLADGTETTQPEFSFWFKDVGWGVENYGTDPDIEVDIMPQDYVQGKDPQLDTAIKVALEELKKNPPLKPVFDKKPQLPLP